MSRRYRLPKHQQGLKQNRDDASLDPGTIESDRTVVLRVVCGGQRWKVLRFRYRLMLIPGLFLVGLRARQIRRTDDGDVRRGSRRRAGRERGHRSSNVLFVFVVVENSIRVHAHLWLIRSGAR